MGVVHDICKCEISWIFATNIREQKKTTTTRKKNDLKEEIKKVECDTNFGYTVAHFN